MTMNLGLDYQRYFVVHEGYIDAGSRSLSDDSKATSHYICNILEEMYLEIKETNYLGLAYNGV